MAIQTSRFAVTRRGETYGVLGVDLYDKLQPYDILLVQRGDEQFKYQVHNPIDYSDLLDTDLLVCTEADDTTYKVTVAQLRAYFSPRPDQEGLDQCLTIAREEYLRCKLLCETAYCQSICDREYAEAKEICYIDNGFPVP
jgi:hypothetical protein